MKSLHINKSVQVKEKVGQKEVEHCFTSFEMDVWNINNSTLNYTYFISVTMAHE